MVKRFPRVMTALIVVLLFIFVYYVNRFGSEAINQRIIKQDGYHVQSVKPRESIEVFVKPEWIPWREGERIEPRQQLLSVSNTVISMDNTWNRGNDMYFSFRTEFRLPRQHGSFLYNYILNEDGSVLSSMQPDDYTLYDLHRQVIPIGQAGIGPGADFSFGIEPQYQQRLKDGFWVKYSGFTLYEYSKK
ncbi:hypothetical protein [Paenibacillus silviterrae]|uniref:hypothetical protein n=1 Tax=Paenibacillus silviterrae TaxID=3242194 RepID=UPI0025428200|nr:hypothetical protein [Paenibacillus chinjuensis]